MEWLKGKKTYIIAGLIAVLSAAKYLGYVNEETFNLFTALLAGGGLATLRSAKEVK